MNPNAVAASSGAIVRGRRPPQCPSTAQQPTPILKSSSTALLSKRKRRPPGKKKRPSALQFSQDVVILERSMEAEAEEEESDTDVGSHGDFDDDEEGGDFSFDGGEEEVDFGAGSGGLFGDVAHAGAPCGGSSPVTRAAAKVRRLTLGGADNDGGEATMDVKTSLARASFGRDSGGSSSLDSPPRKPHGGAREQPRGGGLFGGGGGFGSPPSSPPRGTGAHPRRNNSGNMPLCPPSTAKKSGGVSRLFTGPSRENDSPNFGKINTNADVMEEEEEEDVSPRDVVEFPFFAASPSSTKTSGKVNFQQNLRNVDSMMDPGSPMPQCPPSTLKKKPHRRAMDLNPTDRTTGSRDPPKGLKAVGRANSFLQMFSQEVPVDALRQIHEGDGGDDGDEGGDGGFLSKPTRQNSEWSVGGEQTTMTTCPSPRRPMRGHRRFTPDSPAPPARTQQQASSPFSRFAADFEVVGTLGNGAYGHVYKVRHRTDRRMYAIKAARREARGASDRDRMLQEVYALAALSDQACAESMHIVRYFQAWMEENRLYIQTELCDGTLQEEMARGMLKDEKRRYKLLREMLLALDLVHKSGSIHLDIKPDNIFVKNDRYKLGDFGLVSKIEDHKDVEEGDSRYMSMELLQGDLDDLTKSDIFSLGATMYEICLDRDTPLPENGPEWQDMRRGQLLPMPRTAFDLTMIVREMMAPDPHSRPSAEELLKKRQLLSDEQKQLIAERNKAEAANKALDAQKQRMIKLLSPKANPRKFARSNTFC